jgi:hypothetical protein
MLGILYVKNGDAAGVRRWMLRLPFWLGALLL